MTTDPARAAAVESATSFVEEGMTIGLGSGRAVFALAAAIGARREGRPAVRAVVASEATADRAVAAGIPIVELRAGTSIDVAFDGADEVDPELALIKGAGAALLREKLVIAAARRVVILAEAAKKVPRLGTTRALPVEIIRFGWETTRSRVEAIAGPAALRADEHDTPVVTDEGHYLLDVRIDRVDDLRSLAAQLKGTLGVVDHGLFLDEADVVLFGDPQGQVERVERERRVSS